MNCFQISDRIGALCDGELSPVKPVQQTTIEQVGSWMAGLFDEPATANQHAIPEQVL